MRIRIKFCIVETRKNNANPKRHKPEAAMRIFLLFTILLSAACTKESAPPLSFTGNAMGTTWKVVLVSSGSPVTQSGIATVIEKIEALASP